MTDEQINAAIAREIWYFSLVWDALMGHEPNHCKSRIQIKNYVSDLNAMHEVEKMLNKAQWEDFVQHLANDWSSVSDAWKDVCHATARQRAEAFLRTLGKWNDQSGDATEMVKEVEK